MKRPIILGSLGAVVLIAFALTMYPHFAVVAQEKMAMPFGGKEDVDFASKAWKAMEGYQKWLVKSDMLPGKSPHGAFLQLYYIFVNDAGTYGR